MKQFPIICTGCAETQHQFILNEPDWGFSQFMPLEDALAPDKGFLVDDSMTVKVKIEVLNPVLDEDIQLQTQLNNRSTRLRNPLVRYGCVA